MFSLVLSYVKHAMLKRDERTFITKTLQPSIGEEDLNSVDHR